MDELIGQFPYDDILYEAEWMLTMFEEVNWDIWRSYRKQEIKNVS
jgi:hypothetical protein